jgi:hypothetical protein
MYTKYEVDVATHPDNKNYVDHMRDINTNSRTYNLVHVGLLALAAVLGALGINELTGSYFPSMSYLPVEVNQSVEVNAKSLAFLYSSIACFILFAAMSLIDNLRKSTLARLADLSDDQCYRMSEFLKKAISQDVHNYVNGVRILKRPFTVGEFRALVEHEEVSTRDLRLAKAKEELYAIPPENAL